MFGLDFIRKLKPCKWRYIGQLDDGVEHFGFIAQDIEELAPHHQFGFVSIASDGTFRLSLGEFIGPLTKAVQELDNEVQSLKEEIRKLKEKEGL